MALITVNTDPSRKELRQFGFIWLVFLSFFGAVAWFKLDALSTAKGLWIAAVLVPLVGWFVPSFMRLVYVGMSFAAFPIGWVVSHVVLAIVFYLVLTPIGLIMRVLGNDPMHRRFDPDAPTYWIDREPHPDPKQYFRQW
jgi:fatty acid desaturase